MISSARLDSDESELVRSAAGGDRTAQQALFDRHHRGVMGYCLLACNGDRERALELTQDTFLRALSSLRQLHEPSRFRNWLFSIAANLCRGRGAQEARRRELLVAARLSFDATPSSDEAEQREARIALVQRGAHDVAWPCSGAGTAQLAGRNSERCLRRQRSAFALAPSGVSP